MIYGASSLLRALYNLAFPPTLHHLEFLEILSSQVRMNGVSQKSQKLRNTSCHSLRILVPYLGINTKECYLNKLVECKVKFYQIGEAYESQTVNLHKSAS